MVFGGHLSPPSPRSAAHLLDGPRSGFLYRRHIRSCDSLDRISAGVIPLARSGTASRSMRIPPSPALASSEVAQDSPAPTASNRLVIDRPRRRGSPEPRRRRSTSRSPLSTSALMAMYGRAARDPRLRSYSGRGLSRRSPGVGVKTSPNEAMGARLIAYFQGLPRTGDQLGNMTGRHGQVPPRVPHRTVITRPAH